MWHSVDQLFDFASIYRLHNRLSAREMSIQRADTDVGAARDFFQAHIQPDFREPCLGGVDQRLSIPGTVGAGFARLGRWLSFHVIGLLLTQHLQNGGSLRILNGGSLHFQLDHVYRVRR